MRLAAIAIGAVLVAGSAAAQLGGGTSSSPELGRTATSSGGANDSFRPGAGWTRLYDANGHMREADYRAMLARRIAQAEAVVGQPLTERDAKKIRSAMRTDFIAWRKQYDPRPRCRRRPGPSSGSTGCALSRSGSAPTSARSKRRRRGPAEGLEKSKVPSKFFRCRAPVRAW